MTRIARLLALATLVSCTAAAAATYPVDDSGTVVSQPVTQMRWRQPMPSRMGDNRVEGRLNAALRLNLSSWLHRSARIYMSLAPTEGDQLSVTWRTQGRLLPGAVRSGGRTLVFEGEVRDAYLMETIELDIVADGRQLTRAQSLHFTFDIETSP